MLEKKNPVCKNLLQRYRIFVFKNRGVILGHERLVVKRWGFPENIPSGIDGGMLSWRAPEDRFLSLALLGVNTFHPTGTAPGLHGIE